MGTGKKIAVHGLMLAVIFTLTTVEHMLPPVPLLPPGVRLGLSNIVTMYCAFFISRASAVTLNAIKALFVLSTRGPIPGSLSFCGGMLSILAVILLLAVFKERISYAAVSVAGACVHNLGQYIAASFWLGENYLLFYLPILLGSGVVMGLATGTLLKVTLPALKKIK